MWADVRIPSRPSRGDDRWRVDPGGRADGRTGARRRVRLPAVRRSLRRRAQRCLVCGCARRDRRHGWPCGVGCSRHPRSPARTRAARTRLHSRRRGRLARSVAAQVDRSQDRGPSVCAAVEGDLDADGAGESDSSRSRPLWRRGRLRLREERRVALELIERFGVTPHDSERTVAQLSGGNQQKVSIAKWMRTAPRLLVLDEPTQGVDVDGNAEILNILREAASSGVAILICSSDLEDLAQVCNRVLIVR
ncbi:MAG: ATP-binding cassette domain-containing protein, partial [Actinobacteria bacterium]